MKYANLDQLIVERIRSGTATFNALEAALNVVVKGDWRLIDRRLQALKKAGVLRFVRGQGGGAWEVIK
jgi:hypothetical protein